MKKVIIGEYKNYVDNNYKPVGHAIKSIKEAVELLQESFDVEIVACNEYCTYMSKNICKKSSAKCVCTNKKGVVYKIISIIDRLLNIKKIFSVANGNIVWFINVDWVLFLYLGLFGKKSNKLIVTSYCDRGKYVKKQFRKTILKGISLVDLFIVTNKNLKNSNNCVFLPDYYYDEKYSKYGDKNKTDEVLIIGTIRREKKIREAYDLFERFSKKLLIAGQFYEKELYDELVNRGATNIVIINKRLSDDEYLSLISKHKYILLPYDNEEYHNATSGVLLECMFLGSIPIAPKKLLEYNSVSGLGYDSMDDIITLMDVPCENIIKENNARLCSFDKQKIKANLISAIEDCL